MEMVCGLAAEECVWSVVCVLRAVCASERGVCVCVCVSSKDVK